ncbi:DNA primase [Methylocystis sp. MJC1]|jgi:DNA primase|uniref:DNA primase n=1 Tax=Methylocystis sp. MJC1 TaxID=2654282 RepID=UPI0013ED0F82|nr:DNA primase [Methylocystis sp. MJC1]KAF2991246.1 DNA primase [Methylocystis sp. MJC1]MBU6526214.1 DNA primase [Methylocystis sp. MJC1]UZX12668.1 DNA primase [Methylocystis sp. MJC1]
MRFSPSFLDEIRARVPVSEVVRKKVKLTKQGREWRGLSPFNAEKTPSFYVNDHKGFFHDFSSGKHGDGFAFLMETEGLTFPEAVERLASLAGLPMPVETQEQREEDQRRATLGDALEWAAEFFQKQLAAPAGREARAYLDRRQVSAASREKFRLGFAPAERHALRDYLAGKGAAVEIMIEAGLLIHGDDIPVPYDRFRNRVMFPICDRGGRVIAFGGRAMEADAQAKYLNSPETPLFHKGATLYNLHNARKAAHDAGTVIAVEGYMDVIALTAAGFAHAVAPLGTALTPEQCNLLWRMAEEPILCFDGDKAGLKAAFRAVDTALPLIGPGKTLRFVLLPDGQDPDELLRAGGQSAVQLALSQTLPLVDLLWMRETDGAVLDTPERRAGLERRLREIAGQIGDETLRRYYGEELRDRLTRLFGRAPAAPSRGRDFTPRRGRPFRPGAPEASGPVRISQSLANSPLFRGVKPPIAPRDALILLILMNHPEVLAAQVEEVAGLEFASTEASTLRDALVRWTEAGGGERADLLQGIEESGLSGSASRLEGMVAHAALWSVRPEASPADAAESLRQALVLHRRFWALNKELRAVEARLAENSSEQDLARLRDIQTQLSALDGAEAALEGFGASSGRSTRSL